MKQQMKQRLNRVLHIFVFFGLLASSLNPDAVLADDQQYIVVRLDRVWLDNDGDTDGDTRGPEGEIQYFSVVSTGNRGEEPIVAQRVGFPMRNWYEAEDDGPNRDFMGGVTKAVPLFVFPEDEMGDELVISFSVVDDDENSPVAVAAHDILRTVGTIVATAMAGPDWGTLVEQVSGKVHDAIVESGDLDIIGTHTNRLRQSDNFGIPEGDYAETIYRHERNIHVAYSILKVSVRDEYSDWCLSVRLDKVKILEDGDNHGDGEIYIHARAADGFIGEVLDEAPPLRLRERSVRSGRHYPLPRNALDRVLYFNNCDGLPPMLYVEVGVFDEDCHNCLFFPDPDDVLGVLPLTYTNRRLRERPGSHQKIYTVTGHDPDDAKARIYLTLDVWDPHVAPDS